MTGRIPQTFIDEVVARTDIVELIDERVPLRKQGGNYVACCPFHDEKTPSFSVSPDKQFFYCFGCGAHGTAIGFLMDYAHMAFPEAIEELAARAGMEVPHDAQAQEQTRQLAPLYEILDRAKQFFLEQLRSHPERGKAVEYLESRGLTGETAAAFEIGYAPPGWDNLLRSLGGTDADIERLEQAGMLIAKSGGGHYDRFRDRIMFPIADRRGRTIAFGGRTLGDDKPKYLNSPETPMFSKGRELYGLYQARATNKSLERLIVVEGYTDVVALAQFGITCATATLGTATTAEHIDRLFRLTGHVVFCYDGDEAGHKAAWRALQACLEKLSHGRQASFLFLPEGEDPDSLIRARGADDFNRRIEQATPLSGFLFDNLSARFDLSSLDGRARLADNARPLLDKIPPGNFRDLMFTRLNEIAGTSSKGAAAGHRPRRPRAPAGGAGRGGSPSAVRIAIALLLRRPDMAGQVDDLGGEGADEIPGVELLRRVTGLIREHPGLSCAGVLEHWRDTEDGRTLSRLAAWPYPCPDEGIEEEFTGALRLIRTQTGQRQVDRLLDRDRAGGLTEKEKHELKELLGTGLASNKPGS